MPSSLVEDPAVSSTPPGLPLEGERVLLVTAEESKATTKKKKKKKKADLDSSTTSNLDASEANTSTAKKEDPVVGDSQEEGKDTTAVTADSTNEHQPTNKTKKKKKQDKTITAAHKHDTTDALLEEPTEITTMTDDSFGHAATSPLTSNKKKVEARKNHQSMSPTVQLVGSDESDDVFRDEPASADVPTPPTKKQKKKKKPNTAANETDVLNTAFLAEEWDKIPSSEETDHFKIVGLAAAKQQPPPSKPNTESKDSKSHKNNIGLQDAVNHPRREAMLQRKQRRKDQSSQQKIQHPGAFSVDPAMDQSQTLAHSAGTQVARQRQLRKERKQRGSTTSTSTNSNAMATSTAVTTVNAATTTIEQPAKDTVEGLRRKASHRLSHAKKPKGIEDQDIAVPEPAATTRRAPSTLQPRPSSTTMMMDPPDLISAQLVTDFDDHGHVASRDSIYQQAHRDAERQVREDLLRDVLVAEEVVDEDHLKQRQCRTWTAISVSVVVVVAILAGVLGSQPWKDDAPAASAAPVNDLCTGALALTLEDARKLGNTQGASPVNFESCTSSVQPGGLGVWYSIEGTGNPMRVSTCDSNSTESYDTQITLFQGTCESHVCVGANDNGQDDACGVFSSLTWPSVLGETYILCVHGKFAATDEESREDVFVAVGDSTIEGTPLSGTFQLTVDETADNDFCETSTLLEINNPVSGSTEDATSDTQVSFCHGTESTAPGVWYRVTGNGKVLRASLSNVTTNLQLTVYEGSTDLVNAPRDDCRTIRCIAGYDNPFDHHSQVTFTTSSDTSYYILVHGVDGQRGSFELKVQQRVDNDLCDTAISISLIDETTAGSNTTTFLEGEFDDQEQIASRVIQGSTALATLSGLSLVGASCDGVIPTGACVWYTITGTGSIMRAFTCIDSEDDGARASLEDTTLTVFRGNNCRNLQCVVGNDDSCGQHSLVEWESKEGDQYFLLVSGKLEERGSFELTIESIGY